MEKLFESMLWNSRIVLVFGVISCMVTGVSLICLGLYEVIHLISALFDYLITHSSNVTRDNIILFVVEILDTFLLSAILFIFAFGLAFQLPVALTLMAKANIVDYQTLKKFRKYAIVLAFLAAAFLTPPDPFSQISLALPIIILYEILHCF